MSCFCLSQFHLNLNKQLIVRGLVFRPFPKKVDKIEIEKGYSLFLLLIKAPVSTKKLSCNHDLLEISILVYIPWPLFYWRDNIFLRTILGLALFFLWDVLPPAPLSPLFFSPETARNCYTKSDVPALLRTSCKKSRGRCPQAPAGAYAPRTLRTQVLKKLPLQSNCFCCVYFPKSVTNLHRLFNISCINTHFDMFFKN